MDMSALSRPAMQQVVDDAAARRHRVSEHTQRNLFAADRAGRHGRGARLREAAGRLFAAAFYPGAKLVTGEVFAAEQRDEFEDLRAVAAPRLGERLEQKVVAAGVAQP